MGSLGNITQQQCLMERLLCGLLLTIVLGLGNVTCQILEPSAKLVSGDDADQGSHPWHMGLVREESKTGVLGWIRHLGGLLRTTTYCGVTLVSHRWLLTAAHCIRSKDRPVDLRVVMGSSLRARFFYYFFQTDSIDQIYIHPNYNNRTHEYDIALLRLKEVPELEPGEVWPVCLPTAPVESYADSKAVVIGWGKTAAGSDSARKLQELDVNVISQAECQEQWSYGRGRVEVGGPKMCFRSSGASCHGDSGSGMFQTKVGTHTIIGVCSYGLSDCKNWAPEVYTKVSYVLDWIKVIFGDDAINVNNCGIAMEDQERQGSLTWSESLEAFFDGRQAYRKK